MRTPLMPPRRRPGEFLHEQLQRQAETIARLQRRCEEQRQVINRCCEIAADDGDEKIRDLEYQCILIAELCRAVQDQVDVRV